MGTEVRVGVEFKIELLQGDGNLSIQKQPMLSFWYYAQTSSKSKNIPPHLCPKTIKTKRIVIIKLITTTIYLGFFLLPPEK